MAQRGPPAPSPLPRDFLRLLSGWFLSLTGDGLRIIALPLLANAHSADPAAVATVAACTALPWLVVAIPAGALVDRWDPVRVVVTAHLFRALTTGLLAVTIALGSVSILLLCVFGFLLTAAETFADGAAQTLLVGLVGDEQLERANSRFVTVETVALDLVGPVVGGIAFVVNTWLPFALSAVGFLTAAGLLTGLHRETPSKMRVGPHPPILGQVRFGLTQLFSDRVLRTLVLAVGVMALAYAAQDGVLVIFATRDLGMSAQWYPTLMVALSAGVLLAAALVGRLKRWIPSGRLMVIVATTSAAALTVMGVWPNVAVALTCYALLGLSSGIWNVLSASRRQRRTPGHMVARVSSAFRVIAWGAMPIGAAIGGGLAQGFSVRSVFIFSGLITFAVVLAVAPSFLAREPEDLPVQRSPAG